MIKIDISETLLMELKNTPYVLKDVESGEYISIFWWCGGLVGFSFCSVNQCSRFTKQAAEQMKDFLTGVENSGFFYPEDNKDIVVGYYDSCAELTEIEVVFVPQFVYGQSKLI